jgi:NTP pyrophosphatase (non-canonical NTP hydrolase)
MSTMHIPTDLITEAFRVSYEQETKSLSQLCQKAAEEVGELNQADLSMNGAAANQWRGKTKADVMEEIVDILLVDIALIARAGMSPNELRSIMERKLRVWQEKLAGTYKKAEAP